MRLLALAETLSPTLSKLLGRYGPEQLRKLAVGVLALLIVMRVGGVALDLRRLSAAAAVPAQASADAAGSRQLAVNATKDEVLDRVLEAHLFGSYADPARAATGLEAKNWTLSGTMAGATPESGWAILAEGGEPSVVRSVGQDAAAGFRLAQVFADRVILSHLDQPLTLLLPGAIGRSRLIQSSNSLPALASAAAPRDDAAERTSEAGENDIPLAMVAFTPEPYRDERGHYAGMQLMEPGGVELAKYGLKPQDVITQVDGRPINSQAVAIQALEQISSGAQVTLTVERGGAQEQMSLAFTGLGG